MAEPPLVRTGQAQAYEYADPVTEFLECLFVRYDFEGAQHKLAQCEEVLDGDFFLSALREEFVENARLFIFETYCRIHQARAGSSTQQTMASVPARLRTEVRHQLQRWSTVLCCLWVNV